MRNDCQSCQTLPAKFGQILLRTDTRLVFCNRKLMRTDIFFTRTTKPICNFTNSGVCNKKEMKDFKCCIHFFQAFLAFALGKSPEGESIFNNKSWISHKILFACKPTCMNLHKIGSCHSHTEHIHFVHA